jgi:hypothetical protein
MARTEVIRFGADVGADIEGSRVVVAAVPRIGRRGNMDKFFLDFEMTVIASGQLGDRESHLLFAPGAR